MATHSNSALQFVFFPPSPWSERARWALDHSGISYDTTVFTPLVSNTYVRWISRNFTEKLTIPVAVDHQQGKTILRDSLSIAQHSNQRRRADRDDLFPAEHQAAIAEWHNLSETLLDILRDRANPRMKQSRALQLNNLPPLIPDPVKPLFLPLSRYALAYFDKKYGLGAGDHDNILKEGLEKIRTALSASASGYLLDRFTFADITIAVIFQAICPGDNTFVPIDDATRECWNDPELIQQYGDLIAWRDTVYRQHRIAAASGSLPNAAISA